MKHLKAVATGLGILLLAIVGNGHAQWGVDPMVGIDMLMQEQNQRMAQMDAYTQQMDAYWQQQMLQAQQRVNEAYANAQRFYVDYYRQHTGDYATPDHLAAEAGANLHCQHHPVQCQESIRHGEAMARIGANGHAQRMADIDAWGRTMTQIGQDSSDILDLGFQGHMGRQAASDAGQANLVQQAIHGEATFLDPSTGAGYSLPVVPDPAAQYQTPDGYPLGFDYRTSSWYRWDGFGSWIPLGQQP